MNQSFAPDRRDPHAGGFVRPLEEEGEERESAIDLARIGAALFRSRYIVLGVMVTAITLAIVLTLLARPRYTAQATVQIDQQTAKVLESEDSESSAQVADADRFLQTQLDILKSRSLAVRVMDSLSLARNDYFITRMGEKPATETVGTLDLRNTRREQILRLIQTNMGTQLPRNSRIAQISFVSPDATLAANVANSFAENFITANLQRRYDTSAYARGFLEKRLADVRQRLQDSERAMIDYAKAAQLIDASNGVVNPSGGDSGQAGPRSLTVTQLVQTSGALTQARNARLAAEGRWNQARRTPLMSLPEVLANPAIQQLSQQRAQLVASYQEERQRRKAEYPTMVQAAAQIAELDSQIRSLATSILNSLRDNYQTLLAQEDALTGDVGSLKGATLTEQSRSIRYNILRRDVDTNRALYDGLLQRYKDVSAQAGIATNNISIIDRADPPLKPTSPRPLLNLVLGLMLGTIAAIALVFLREKFDDKIRAAEDVRAKLGQPLLATVPIVAVGSTPIEELNDVRSNLSEAYYTLRTALELSTSAGVPRTLLVTSSRPSEGKSTTSYAIARNFAGVGKRVVIVDADLRKPSLHRLLGRPNALGFSSLLARQQTIDAVVQDTDVPNLSFIASGALPPNPAELLASAALAQVLDEIQAHYDIVVLDGPPVLGLADAAQLSSVVAGTVFVVEANGGRFGVVKTSVRRLTGSRANLLGVVLTKFDLKRLGYGYGYNYDYNYSYAYGDTGKGKGA